MRSIHSEIHPVQGNSNCSATNWQARKTDAYTFAYTQNSMDGAAASVKGQAEIYFSSKRQGSFNKDLDFLIAHSQGGIVARYLDRSIDQQGLPKAYGGIITFGSPHGGARIINSIENGTVDQFFNGACNIFLNQKISDLPAIFKFLGLTKTLSGIKTDFCDIISPKVLPAFGQELLQPSRNFFKEGSTDLALLNQYSHPNVQKIAAYGVEDNPVMWKTITSFNENASALPCFGADNDTQLQNDVQHNIVAANSKLQEIQSELDACNPIYGLICYLSQRSALKDRLQATKDVKQWFENANTQREVMVGARSYYTTAFQNQCLIKNYQFGNLMSQSTQTVSSPSQCANYEFYNSTNWTTSEPVYNTYWDPMVQENDGVVTKASQMAFPGAHHMRMDGSNHQQMKNDSRTRDVLLRAYGGEVQYFLTNLK